MLTLFVALSALVIASIAAWGRKRSRLNKPSAPTANVQVGGNSSSSEDIAENCTRPPLAQERKGPLFETLSTSGESKSESAPNAASLLALQSTDVPDEFPASDELHRDIALGIGPELLTQEDGAGDSGDSLGRDEPQSLPASEEVIQNSRSSPTDKLLFDDGSSDHPTTTSALDPVLAISPALSTDESELPISLNPEEAPVEQREEEESEAGVDNGDQGGEEASQVVAPHRYRPAPRLPRPVRSDRPRTHHEVVNKKSLTIAVRLTFQAGGACHFSLLAERESGMPEEIAIESAGLTQEVMALQEDWYELSSPANLTSLLRDGITWTIAGSRRAATRWMLSARDVYVLGPAADFGGYVSTVSRLVIGENHVVMCLPSYQERVLTALAEAGCTDFRQIDYECGMPDGWVGYKNVKPLRSVPASNDRNILETLRPLAQIEIELEGGIQIDRSSWLLGHGPTIRIRGDLASAGPVLIDGVAAAKTADGVCASPGQHTLGEHMIWSAATSRNYRLVEGEQRWSSWPAHVAATGSVCGAAVLPPARSGLTTHQVLVPPGEFSLLGAKAGAIQHCLTRPGSAVGIVFTSFEPVWIIPRFPLRCDRRASRVGRLSDDLPLPVTTRNRGRADHETQREWSRLILEAHRRKLVCEPPNDVTQRLWSAYEQVARAIWRKSR